MMLYCLLFYSSLYCICHSIIMLYNVIFLIIVFLFTSKFVNILNFLIIGQNTRCSLIVHGALCRHLAILGSNSFFRIRDITVKSR